MRNFIWLCTKNNVEGKFVFALGLILLGAGLTAQVLEDTVSYDIEPDSLELLSYEYTEAADFDFVAQSDTSLPLPSKQLVVRYESSATLFLELNKPLSGQLLLVDRESSGNAVYFGSDHEAFKRQ